MPLRADVVRHLERATRAAEFHRTGRHAAAERLLRDVAGSLVRREAFGSAATTLITLGRVLLERGRAAAAERAFGEAAQRGELAREETCMLDARLWQAAARTDAARLTDAESLCRAVLRTGALPPARQAWAHATLARVLLWQGRSEEAVASHLPLPQREVLDIDPMLAAVIEGTAVRVLLAAGEVFQAGQRARALVTATEPAVDSLPRVAALTAHLRVMAATGDLDLARRTRAPLRSVRASVIWCDALRLAGRAREARRELQRLARLSRVAPPLLRRAIEQRTLEHGTEASRPAVGVVRTTAGQTPSMATALLRLVQEEDSDRLALQHVIDRVARELRPIRVDLLSSAAGAATTVMTTVMTTGGGLATHLGSRVLEAGIVIPEDAGNDGREIGVPVRLGTRLLAALVCRWPLGRPPPSHALDLLEVAAAIAAPRVDGLLTGLRETSLASSSVPGLIGASAEMADVRRAIERAARAPFAVLIEGGAAGDSKPEPLRFVVDLPAPNWPPAARAKAGGRTR